jgi:hypothetical protein
MDYYIDSEKMCCFLKDTCERYFYQNCFSSIKSLTSATVISPQERWTIKQREKLEIKTEQTQQKRKKKDKDKDTHTHKAKHTHKDTHKHKDKHKHEDKHNDREKDKGTKTTTTMHNWWACNLIEEIGQ